MKNLFLCLKRRKKKPVQCSAEDLMEKIEIFIKKEEKKDVSQKH
jgi:hypothetical protein